MIILLKANSADDAAQTGQMLAGLLGWPQATQASKIEFGAGDQVTVTKEVDGGVETVSAKLPMVITTDLRLNEPRYSSLASLMKARKKSIDQVTTGQLGVTLEPRVRVLGLETVPSRRKCVRVGSLDELLVKLHVEEKVL